MKPETLFQIMEEISPDYIAEAKPKYTRVRPGHSSAETRAAAEEDEIFTVQRPVMQRRRKENTMKSSVLQRLTTGLVAAAALAVFVGGGVFIAKQQKDKKAMTSSTPASQIAEQGVRNFLGGTGEVRVMQAMPARSSVIYDDDFFYSADGSVRIPRQGGQITESEASQQYFSDGERFYSYDGSVLYTVGQDGTRTQFFDASRFEPSVHYETDRNSILNIFHIGGDSYVILLLPQKLRDGQLEASYSEIAVLYREETGETVILDQTNEMRWTSLLPDGNNGFYVLPTDDAGETPWIYHYTEAEQSMTSIFSDTEGAINPESMYLSPDGKTLYFRPLYTDNLRRAAELRKISTDELDIHRTGGTESELVLEHVPAEGYLAYEGSLFVFNAERTQLARTDLEWNTQEQLWQADDDTMPEEFRAEYASDNAYFEVIAADENYLFVQLGGPGNLGLFDRKTGEMQYITVSDAQEQTETDTASAALQTADGNLFGGKGELRITAPYLKTGAVLRDDNFYYFGRTGFGAVNFDDADLSTPEETDTINEYGFGGIFTYDPTWQGHDIITDGEQLYTVKGGEIWSLDESGSETLFYRMPGVWKYNSDHSGNFGKQITDETISTFMHVYDDVYMVAGTAFDNETNETINFGYYFKHDKFKDSGKTDDGGYYCLPEYLVRDGALYADLIPAPEKRGFYCFDHGHVIYVPCYEDSDWKVNRVVSPYDDTVIAGSWTVKKDVLYYLNSDGQFCCRALSDDAVVYLTPTTGEAYDTTAEEYAKNAEKTVLYTAEDETLTALFFGGDTVYALTDQGNVYAAAPDETGQRNSDESMFQNAVFRSADSAYTFELSGSGFAAEDRLCLFAADAQGNDIILQIIPERHSVFFVLKDEAGQSF